MLFTRECGQGFRICLPGYSVPRSICDSRVDADTRGAPPVGISKTFAPRQMGRGESVVEFRGGGAPGDRRGAGRSLKVDPGGTAQTQSTFSGGGVEVGIYVEAVSMLV